MDVPFWWQRIPISHHSNNESRYGYTVRRTKLSKKVYVKRSLDPEGSTKQIKPLLELITEEDMKMVTISSLAWHQWHRIINFPVIGRDISLFSHPSSLTFTPSTPSSPLPPPPASSLPKYLWIHLTTYFHMTFYKQRILMFTIDHTLCWSFAPSCHQWLSISSRPTANLR